MQHWRWGLERIGVFTAPVNETVTSAKIGLATGEDAANLEMWRLAMAKNLPTEEEASKNAGEENRDRGNVAQTDALADWAPALPAIETIDQVAPTPTTIETEESLSALHPDKLLPKQRQAYDMVDYHIKETIAGRHPPQLLMIMPGEGGVGKSQTIQTITNNFNKLGIGHALVKAAYTGIAASLIDGKTLHVACGIAVNGHKQGKKTVKKQTAFWKDKLYMIIDEMSMVSRELLAKISGNILRVKQGAGEQTDATFGGVNVILVGDQ